ncbi:14318_t:CDS:2 [Acaulospora morrowiae]|uniref:Autophagy-related protein n=1 Tax=Acaulospora morrowiae TaxID=94023 RepID=A0A9N8VAL3_9GLOM|nr:14318_t:CDS:2 [Acaulospora morrowiae]
MAETNFEVELDDEPSIPTGDQLDIQEPILSKNELYAWYLYAFACEVYAVVSLTSFIPLILEQFSFEKGVLNTDHTIPCNNSTAFSISEEVRCVVNVFGIWVDTASYSLYTYAFSVVLQAITAISIGATADHGAMRKTLLLSFAFAGSVSAMLFLFVTPSLFLLAGVFTIVGNVCFGASFVCFNGFLPVLVRNHQDVRKISSQIRSYIAKKNYTPSDEGNHNLEEDHNNFEEASLLATHNQQSLDPELSKLSEDLEKEKDRISTHISTRGFASGYFGGIILLIVCLIISFLLNSTVFSLQIGVFLSGAWWFLFSLLVIKWLRPRPGPPLYLDNGRKVGWFDYIIFAWTRLWRTVRHAKKLEMSFRFLVAWFFISDGYTTITSVALLFAKTTLHVPDTGLIIIALIVPVVGLIGAILFPKIQKQFDLTTKQTIILLNIMLLCIPIYGCLGFVLPVGGLRSAHELYFLAAWFGFAIGAIQSYCRTLFGELVPRGRETEFFALYAVTDKGSSWLGPTMVAIITDTTHEIRYGFAILLILLLLPIPILLSVDVIKGKADAAKSSENED